MNKEAGQNVLFNRYRISSFEYQAKLMWWTK